MYLYLNKFTKPVAFYPYVATVMEPILEVNLNHHNVNNDDEEEIIHFIEDLRSKCDKLNRRKSNNGLDKNLRDDTTLSSTRKDNKTVIAMSNGEHILYFGRYDGYYRVGLDVLMSYKNDYYTIDLSDLDELPSLE